MPVFKMPKFDRHTHIAINGDIVPDPELAIANGDPMLLARGAVDGASVVHKFGAINDVSTAFKPVTTSKTYQTPKVAEALQVVSTSTDDDGTVSPLGTGALTLKVYGITAWDAPETVEFVTLKGQTPVALVNSYLRIYRIKVDTSGSYADATTVSHNSTITITATVGGAVWAVIAPEASVGLGQSEIALYSIPTGKSAYMTHAEVWVEASKSANLIFFSRDNANVLVAPYSVRQAKIIMRNVQDAVEVDPTTPYGPFVGPCDIGWMAMAVAQTANIEIDFELIIYDA